jgi:hypothetical protein
LYVAGDVAECDARTQTHPLTRMEESYGERPQQDREVSVVTSL